MTFQHVTSYSANEVNNINLIFKKDLKVGFKAVLLLICSLSLMIADCNYKSFHKWRSHFELLTVPLQFVITTPVNVINDVINHLNSHQNLVKENAALKAQVVMLNAVLQKQYAVESDNKSLRALLRSSSKVAGQVTTAQLLAVGSNPFDPEVILNKGTKDKVFVGQPVLDMGGIMGQVVQSGRYTSRVMLITSTKSAVPVQIERTGFRSIAVGCNSASALELQHVTNTTDVRIGDLVIASGLGQRYPFGYPVGKVISVKHNAYEDFANITIAPNAHLNSSRLVLLVWPQKVMIDSKNKSATAVKTKELKNKKGKDDE